MAFPSSVLPNVVAWADGSQSQYSDAAGSALVTAVRAPVRRLNEGSPLSGNWQAPDDAHRPGHDLAGLRADVIGPSAMTRSATTDVSFRDSTIVVSFVARGNTFSSAQGLIALPNAGSGSNYGLTLFQGSQLGLYNGAIVHLTTVPTESWVRTTHVVRFGASSVKIKKIVGASAGTTTDYTETPGYAAITTGASTAALFPALVGGAFYGSLSQALICNRALSDLEATDVGAWAHSQPCPEAFPSDGPLLAVLGDSIAASYVVAQGWGTLSLGGLRPTYPALELCNVAVSGTFTTSLSAQFTTANQFYSPTRARNVMVLASGTNDLFNGFTPASVRDNLFAMADTVRAAGWRVAIANILPRTVGAVGSPEQLAFNAARASANALIAAGIATHTDAPPIDVTTLTGMGADGDSNNTTYFQVDGVHPNQAGHTLLATKYQPSIAAMLSMGSVLTVERLYDGSRNPPTFLYSLPRLN